MHKAVVHMNRGLADNVNALELALEYYRASELAIYWDNWKRYKGTHNSELFNTSIQFTDSLGSGVVFQARGATIKNKIKDKRPILFKEHLQLRKIKPIATRKTLGIHCRLYEDSNVTVRQLSDVIDRVTINVSDAYVASDSKEVRDYAISKGLMVGNSLVEDLSNLSECKTIVATYGGIPWLVKAQASHGVNIWQVLRAREG